MATGNKVYLSSNRGIYFAIFLFLVILGITSWLYYQNTQELKIKTNSLEKKIKQQKKELININNNNYLQVFSLLKSNKKLFEKKEKLSNIPVLINKIEELEKKYKVYFKSFFYNDGKISLQAEARNSNRISKFIGDFRYDFKDEKKIGEKKDLVYLEEIIPAKIEEFKLNFVQSFSGKGKISFNIILEINDLKYKIKKENPFNNVKEKNINKKDDVKKTIKDKIKAQNKKNEEK